MLTCKKIQKQKIIQPDEHEANSADVRAVAVIEDPLKLLLGDFHGAQLVHETVGGGDDAARSDPSHSATHTRLVGGFLKGNQHVR